MNPICANASREAIAIAVVEDDTGMRRAIARLLTAAGYRVHAFASAEALLEAPRPAGIACLVSDVRLPGLSGFELCERLQRAGGAPPVVFITGYDEAPARQWAERLGALAYLAKPFPGAALVAAIEGALAQPGRIQSDPAR